jgi:hypothetical protein
MQFLEISRKRSFGAILFFGLLAMTARNAVDPDLGWHLRAGQWIVENLRVPQADSFSFTRAGYAWVAHEWLSEVVFFELWKHAGGTTALIVFSAIITTAGFMLLYLCCLHNQANPRWAAGTIALGALAAAPSWGVRPQMFTFTLASLLLWLLNRGLAGSGSEGNDPRPKLLLWIPPLFLLWLNLHAGFALGLALLFVYGLGTLIETALGQTPWPQARPLLTQLGLLLAICLALVPLNPSGVQLYHYPLDTLRSPGMRSFIGEWFSPDFHQQLYLPFLVVWMLLLTTLAFSRYRPKWRSIFLLIFTSLAALDAVRHIPIFVLVAIPVIASALRSSCPAAPHWYSTSSRLRKLFAPAVILLMAVFAVVRWTSLASAQDAREQEEFPQHAVRFLKADGQPHRLFAYYDWGGYAIWKLYPRSKVFVDGRADLYGDDILHQFRTVVDLRSGWRHVLNTWDVDAVLVPPSTAVAQALQLDRQWLDSFHDSKAILFLRLHPLVPTEETPHQTQQGDQ